MEKSISISPLEVLGVLSDSKVLSLFNNIALAEVGREFLIGHLKLSRKQYYYRISRLLRSSIITRRKGRYSVTAFGKIVYHAQNLIGIALSNYWKLNALDSLQMLPRQEYNKVVNSLISDGRINKVLTDEQTKNAEESPQLLDQISLSIQKSRGNLGK